MSEDYIYFNGGEKVRLPTDEYLNDFGNWQRTSCSGTTGKSGVQYRRKRLSSLRRDAALYRAELLLIESTIDGIEKEQNE